MHKIGHKTELMRLESEKVLQGFLKVLETPAT
jgi:hypothetical protein